MPKRKRKTTGLTPAGQPVVNKPLQPNVLPAGKRPANGYELSKAGAAIVRPEQNGGGS